MRRRLGYTRLEEAELRRLVYRAWELRGDPEREDAYREALEAIETWYVETLPARLRRASRRSRR
jgi:hypothetical protein